MIHFKSIAGAAASHAIQPGDLLRLLAVVALWALCYPLIVTGLAYAPPLHFAGLRALVAGAFLVITAVALRCPLPSGRKIWLALSLIGLTTTAFGFAGMFLAGDRTSPGLATVLSNIQPLLAAALAYVFLAERLRARQWTALAIGFAGISVIAFSSVAAGPGGTTLVGIALVLLAAAGVAVGNILLKRIALHVDPLMAVGWQLLLGAMPLLLGARIWEGGQSVTWSVPFLLALSTLAVLGTAVASLLWFQLLQRVQLSRLNTFTFLTPLIGLSIGLGFYDERLTTTEWFGGALVVLAILLTTWRQGSTTPALVHAVRRKI